MEYLRSGSGAFWADDSISLASRAVRLGSANFLSRLDNFGCAQGHNFGVYFNNLGDFLGELPGPAHRLFRNAIFFGQCFGCGLL